jgi:hypothetical protein
MYYLYLLRQNRSGSDEAHIADEDIPELGKFVQAGGTKYASSSSDAGVVASGDDLFVVLVDGVGVSMPHGTEFEDGEGSLVATEAHLAE